jgi:hypothetical protein
VCEGGSLHYRTSHVLPGYQVVTVVDWEAKVVLGPEDQAHGFAARGPAAADCEA